MINPQFKVFVRCMTFNHAPYITNTMDGFCMQNTNFPYICCIVDDTSTDSEPLVIQNYLNRNFDLESECGCMREETDDYSLIFARHKSNHNCFFAVFFLKYNHYSLKKTKQPYFSRWLDNSKYIAMCEGDDYWIDSQKLQKQVDILDANSNVQMVYTSFRMVDEENHEIKSKIYERLKPYSVSGELFNRLIIRNFIMTLTVCYRKSIIDEPLWDQLPCHLDYADFFFISSRGDIVYIPEETSCYRKTLQGFSVVQYDRIKKDFSTIFLYFANLFFCGDMKKLSLFDRCRIKLRIAQNIVANPKHLFLLAKHPSLLLYLLPGVFEKMRDFTYTRYFYWIRCRNI